MYSGQRSLEALYGTLSESILIVFSFVYWCLERFSNDCRKSITKVSTPTNNKRNKHRDEFLAITCNLLKAREISRVQGTVGFGFISHWLKNWRETFQPIT